MVIDLHFADLCWCLLAVRAVKQGSIRSVKALIGDSPVNIQYVYQSNVCVCVSLCSMTSYLIASPNKPAVTQPFESMLTLVHLPLIRAFLNCILIEI